MMRRAIGLYAFLLAGVAVGQTWKAGAAKVSISPNEPVWQGGFASRNHPSEGVRQDIFVKALALQHGSNPIAVLVTADLVDSKRDLWDVVAERCKKQFGIPRARLVFNESHNHSAPLIFLRPDAPLLCPLTPQQESALRRYTRGLVDKAVAAVGQAIGALAPATLAFGQSVAGIAVNRRRVSIERGLPAPVDQDVPVLSVSDPAGRLVAVVVGYACHATVLSDYQIDGDWPGYAQAEIEKAHPGAVAVFVQGCGADANALPRNSVELAQNYGGVLAAAAEEVLRSKQMKPLAEGLKAAFDVVNLPFQKAPTPEELRQTAATGEGIDKRHAERLPKILERDGKLMDRYPYPVQVWQFGGALKIIFLGGEVVADYALRLKAQYGWDTTWVAGYSNDVMTYIPSERVLKEGGYEGGEAVKWEDLPAPFAPGIEELIVTKVAQVLR